MQLIVGAAAVVLLAFACWLLFGWGGPATIAVITPLGSLTFTLFALACTGTAALTTTGRARVAWGGLALALLAWSMGNAVWAYYAIAHDSLPPASPVADAAYLVPTIIVCAAWTMTITGEGRLGRVRPLLDGLIVAGALFLICWVLLLKDMFEASRGNNLELALALAHPLGDIVMITMALVIMMNAPKSQRRTIALLTAGLIAVALADTALAYLNFHGIRSGNVAVIGWAIGLLLMATSALSTLGKPPLSTVADPHLSRRLSWLPYLPMPFAMVLGVVRLWSAVDRPLLVVGTVLMAVALIRQLIVLGDNRGLRATVAEQALRDPLTGLANRRLFSDRLSHAMELRQRDGRQVAVLSLDLDDFKLVNDNLGHPSGDALLKAVADRLLSIVPMGDALARLGGDEFAIVIEEGSLPAEELAQRVVEMFDKPFFLDGEDVYMHPSVGLATTASDADGRISADELSKRADLARHTAKRAGVGGVQEFTTGMRHDDRAEVRTAPSNDERSRRAPVAGIQLLGQLRRAIDERELILVYQPKINLLSDCMVGVEALVRWPHPELGLLTPNQFLPLVRQNGLMDVVTDLVLTTAVSDAARWYAPHTCDVPVAINLFAPVLNDLTLPDRISAALEKAELPPAALSFELTEHLLLANIRRARTIIDQLRARGLRIAIDDFGSGYATMSYLRDLPIDELKLDRQFIAPILRSERAAAIVRSVIDLAHALGIACVAEGVEDKATADRLREYGCDIAQGHYFSRPMSADALLARCQDGCSTSPVFGIVT
ncbi:MULTISPECIES: putative bifunctional diguanylate cyclase/phosphodiesterase [unclassified Mycobacterium]|uniref:putative bifunctional diguanylate cyclase/phosphodiesterase n=1 Tax=unclassified Mycobacterium TaxID=2642494 RepID=UPI0029C65D1E|nr:MULTISPECIES: EAL domain-containing protein [unclassified Mycobacterium]